MKHRPGRSGKLHIVLLSTLFFILLPFAASVISGGQVCIGTHLNASNSGRKNNHPITDTLVARSNVIIDSNLCPCSDVDLRCKSGSYYKNQAKEFNPEKRIDGPYVRFEDYSDENMLGSIIDRLSGAKESERGVRFAFLGDSFIEADILTADIREQLQSHFGGRGVGFVPVASVASGYRTTVTHSSSGWRSFSMLDNRRADWRKLMFSGFYFIPQEGAVLSVKPGRRKDQLVPTKMARFFFINENNTQIKAVINDSIIKTYSPHSSSELQSIDLDGEISSVKLTFSNVNGFVGYGIYLNDEKGVYVDNYSVRGYSGVTLSSINADLSKRFDQLLPNDVIILQYGLNVAGVNVTNYTNYKRRMISVINTLKSYFPNTAFIIMSVSDRAVRTNNQYETIPGIISMVNVQRDIARETGIIFWDTFTAMGGKNSMLQFVSHKPPLASKDYTHINYAGGKRIAEIFVNSLLREVNKPKPQMLIAHKPKGVQLTDSLRSASAFSNPLSYLRNTIFSTSEN